MAMSARIFLFLVLLSLNAEACTAAERILTLSFSAQPQRITAAELLARPDAAVLIIPNDVSYGREMKYRAVPLLGLIGNALNSGVDTIEARALDGFVSQIPSALVQKGSAGGAVAWIAVEDPDAPWPNLPGQESSAGPFYLVWENPERSNIGREQWPFSLAALSGAENPITRWPQMAVDPALPEKAAERQGQSVFIRNCMPCHRVNGAGRGEMGPDLGQPMNVTEYMSEAGLRALIRDPKSVRTWPQQQMIGFDKTTVSDTELDALIAYLAYMAKHKPVGNAPPPQKPAP
jgi:mono/diheme cytochrome c family protein